MRADANRRKSFAACIHASVTLQIATVAFGYLVFSAFAFHYALTRNGVVVVWLPNAVVLSALLLTRSRQWWIFCLTLLMADFLADGAASPFLQTLGFALGNLFEVLLSAYLIRRLCGPGFAFSNLREVLLFAAIATGLAPALAALFGTWIQCQSAPGSMAFLQHWQIWWMGDSLGMIVLTPLLFGWLHLPREVPPRVVTHWAEKLAFALLLLGLLQLLFLARPDPQTPWVGSPLLLLPMFLWAAMRLGTRGVSLVGFVVSLLAMVFTFQGRGMFSLLDAEVQTLVLQQYLAALLLTGLAVAAILNDLHGKYHSLRLFKQAIDSMGEGLAIADARQSDLPIVYCNPKFKEITGYANAEILGRNCRFLNTPHRAQPALEELRQRLASAQPFSAILQNFKKDGAPFWNHLSTTPVWSEAGELTHVIGIQRDVTDIHAAQKNLEEAHAALTVLNQELEQRVAKRTAELERLATTDALTDAYNRRFLLSRAEIEIAQGRRQGHAVSLVMFDIDHFKHINDSHGHAVGDRVLVALSQSVKQEMRLGDTFARVGGEEFVLLLPRSDAQQSWQVAERMRQKLEALEIDVQIGQMLRLTASFGVATTTPQISSVDALYVASDKALYRAKNAGRNCVASDPALAYSS